VEYEGEEELFYNTNGRWITDEGAALDRAAQNAITALLATTHDLTTQDFIDRPKPLQDYGLDASVLRLFITADYGQGFRFGLKQNTVYVQTDTSRQASPPSDDTIYVLPPDTLERFAPALNVLFPEAKQ
jgi:hypothetical protein